MTMDTVPRVFMNSVNLYGDRVALRHKEFGIWRDISWNDYYKNSRYIAQALISMGLKKGDRVAIIGDNCPEWVFANMGVLLAGGATVGVYATNAWDQCQYVINHSDSKFFFMENEEQLDKWLQFKDNAPLLEKAIVWDLKGLRGFKDPKLMTFDEVLEIGKKLDSENSRLIPESIDSITPQDNALFIYTSGTTGRPKGAILTHKNAVWIGEAMALNNNINDKEEVLSFLPLCHIFEHMMTVFVHVRHGYTVNFVENLDTITDNMREISPTIGYAVPRIWEKYYSSVVIKMSDATLLKRIFFKTAMSIGTRYINLLEERRPIPVYISILYSLLYFAVFRKLRERLGFERMRLAYSGAAPISPGVLTFFNIIGVRLLEGYGQTEGTGVTAVNIPENAKIGTVGPPLNGVEVRIGDDGEILVRSPGVFSGYYKDPETTATTLRDGWLHSGDVGMLDDDGRVIITGRLKDIIINASGKNITPQYIEGKLVFSPYINDAIVIGDRRSYITAIIVLDEDNVVKYAQDNKIQYSYYSDLAKNSAINNLIQQEIDKANSELSRVEQIKKFAILPHKLYEEEGDVTPTMKVKRKFINEKYKDLINEMYR